MRLFAFVLGVAVVFGCGKNSDQPPPNQGAQQPSSPEQKALPEAVVKAWKNAGAKEGWIGTNQRLGFVMFMGLPSPGAVPAFRLEEWNSGVVAKLPAPEVPFGLDLYGTKLTDAGVKELAAMKNLVALDLLGCEQVTDSGMKDLAAIQNLFFLNLCETQVTDDGLKELVALKNLTSLYLKGKKVTDAGVKELTAISTLTDLTLSNTLVTDAGLKELAKLKSLTTLDLTYTPTTKEGVAELQRALPRCKITKP